MSLASFHLLFIAASILLAMGAGVWGVQSFIAGDGTTTLVFGIVSLVAIPVLCVYGVRVRRKLRALGALQ